MTPPSPRLRVAILGAGITGLTAAWRLQQAGHAVTLFERSNRAGGVIQTFRHGPWMHELGPNSLIEGSVNTTRLIAELGLETERIYASPEAKHRYIVKNGKLVAMPSSALSFVASPLFSLCAKLSMIAEPWKKRLPGNQEESVARFVERRLHREFLDYAINPFVGGVYAGNPKRLSVAHAFPKLHRLEQEHGSLIRGALRRRNTTGGPSGRIYSFKEGLEALPRRLAGALANSIRLNSNVRRLRRGDDGWHIETTDSAPAAEERFDVVVSTLPAYVLAHLQIAAASDTVDAPDLAQIYHPPVTSVLLGYPRDHVTHPLNGFGLLVPEVERRGILGCLFSSTLFDGRSADGHVALTVFVGGSRQPQLAAFDDQKLLSLLQSELEALIGVRAPPSFSHIQRWAQAIPQYELGYQKHKDTMSRIEHQHRGLLIGGNARDGISVSNCIDSGVRLAEQALQWALAKPSAR